MEDHYHHGNLGPVLLDEAATMSAEAGPENISLRELARRAGVSHAAPSHHFGSRRGLLTALAAEGFLRLRQYLEAAGEEFIEVGVAYVRFARTHPGHYAVMFAPALLEDTDPQLVSARAGAWALLQERVEHLQTPDARIDPQAAAHAAFALVHGLSSLWASGAIDLPTDPDAHTRQVARQLFGCPDHPSSPST